MPINLAFRAFSPCFIASAEKGRDEERYSAQSGDSVRESNTSADYGEYAFVPPLFVAQSYDCGSAGISVIALRSIPAFVCAPYQSFSTVPVCINNARS
ncbi:MAG: hypothetical protein LBI05_03540 [Planctomycetaceae bacterium]|nr:hypothetical protein [Planctomycetaceae bacterium]